MLPLMYFSFRKVLLVYLVLFFSASSILLLSASAESGSDEVQSKRFFGSGRRMLEMEKEEKQLKKKNTSSSSLSSKNQTKLIKPSLSSKNQTKLLKSNNLSSKNQTKIMKPTNSTKLSNILSKSDLKKLNSTSTKTLKKPTNSTKITSKSSDLLKLSSSKNKTSKPTSTKQTQKLKDLEFDSSSSVSSVSKQSKNGDTITKPKTKKTQKQTQPSWIDQDDDDLVSEFRDLPTKFQQTLIPDLERISTTSKAYINKYNKQISRNFKPFVGNKYASTIASIVSFAFILIPLVLVSLIFHRIKAYFSLQKILIFIQVYLSIYFSILCLSALVTGLEPLKFFYATSQSTYVCVQVLQTLGYLLYLLLLLMYLILVFSTDCGLGSRMLGLGQTFVGYAVGLHYYVAVFHRVVLHEPPKTNWKIHGIYATCFLVICLFATAERRKKAYLEEGGREGKQS